MIKNGIPYTSARECHLPWARADSDLMEDLSEKRQLAIMKWIRINISPRKSVNKKHSSYGLKHMCENDGRALGDPGLYCTNNQFKDAMMQSGYYPVNPNEQNWWYRISIQGEGSARRLDQIKYPIFIKGKWVNLFDMPGVRQRLTDYLIMKKRDREFFFREMGNDPLCYLFSPIGSDNFIEYIENDSYARPKLSTIIDNISYTRKYIVEEKKYARE